MNQNRFVKKKYEVIPPRDSLSLQHLSRQLLSRHRNCFEVAVLMEHLKHISLLSHLDTKFDTPLEKDELPNGRLDCNWLWIILNRVVSKNMQTFLNMYYGNGVTLRQNIF